MSTIVPIAIAIPASDMMLASTPNTFMAMNDISTAIGSVMAITMLARTCKRNNTITAMVVDIETRRPRLANITGGLSGPAIKPVAVRMVWQVAQVVRIPVIGIGGIMKAEDALEYFIAGASAVQVGTANFINPHVTMDVIDGIERFLAERDIASISDIIGTLETG